MAVIFFIAEVLTPAFGLLTAAGLVSLILGAMLLPFEPLLPPEWFQAFRRTVLGMAVVTGGFLALVAFKLSTDPRGIKVTTTTVEKTNV